MKLRAELGPYAHKIDVVALEYSAAGVRAVATNMVMETIGDGLVSQPTFSLTMTDAQEFMDDLWRCGLRPSEGKGSAGSLAATENHLKDMRRLVFGLVAKQGVEVSE